jgi:hypothetical protein
MQCLLFRTQINFWPTVRNFWLQSAVGADLRLDIAIEVVSMSKLECSIFELNLCVRYLKMLPENDFSSAAGPPLVCINKHVDLTNSRNSQQEFKYVVSPLTLIAKTPSSHTSSETWDLVLGQLTTHITSMLQFTS